jgi:hypothetical protein
VTVEQLGICSANVYWRVEQSSALEIVGQEGHRDSRASGVCCNSSATSDIA